MVLGLVGGSVDGGADEAPVSRAMSKGEEIARWTVAILGAISAFAIAVAARGFLYKAGEPDELSVWAVSTVAGVIVGTVSAPPQHRKASRALFIGLAVSASVIMLLGGVAAPHSVDAADVKRVAGSTVGGIAAWIILRRVWQPERATFRRGATCTGRRVSNSGARGWCC